MKIFIKDNRICGPARAGEGDDMDQCVALGCHRPRRDVVARMERTPASSRGTRNPGLSGRETSSRVAWSPAADRSMRATEGGIEILQNNPMQSRPRAATRAAPAGRGVTSRFSQNNPMPSSDEGQTKILQNNPMQSG